MQRRKSFYLTTNAEQQAYAAEHEQFIKTTNALSEHSQWHMAHGGGGGTGAGSGLHFLEWHRYFIRKLEDHLGAVGGLDHHVPIPYWPSNAQIPAALALRINDATPNVAPPTWTTMQGGATPDPVFGHTSLKQFRTTDEIGRAVGASYHGTVHGAIGGDMSDPMVAPRAPIFYEWHGYLDHIWAEWQRRAMPVPAAIARGNVGSPNASTLRINLFMRGRDGKLMERYWNGSGWSWVDTGKEVLGEPAIVVRGNKASTSGSDIRINLFVQGADGKLWERYWNGSAWSWVDTGKMVDGDPVVIVRGNAGATSGSDIRINLFVRGQDGKLWERYWNGSAWAWVDTGKLVEGTPVALVRGDVQDVEANDLRINLFVRGADGKLWERYWNGSGWSWVDTGKNVADDPVVIARGNLGSPDAANLRVNLFVRGQDGKLWERYWNGSAWSWVDTGKGAAGRPAILVRGNAASTSGTAIRINLFVQGTDGKLWERYWNGSAWNWSDTGKKVDGTPLVFARGNLQDVGAADIRINLFARVLEYDSTNHPHVHLQERYWNGSGWSWSDTGKEVAGTPMAIVRGDVEDVNADDLRVNLFVAGADGKLWERYWNGGGWSWVDAGLDVAY